MKKLVSMKKLLTITNAEQLQVFSEELEKSLKNCEVFLKRSIGELVSANLQKIEYTILIKDHSGSFHNQSNQFIIEAVRDRFNNIQCLKLHDLKQNLENIVLSTMDGY